MTTTRNDSILQSLYEGSYHKTALGSKLVWAIDVGSYIFKMSSPKVRFQHGAVHPSDKALVERKMLLNDYIASK